MQDTHSNKSIEFARVIDWEPQWSFGAPLPQIFSNGHHTYLIYVVDTPDPDWDGSHTTLIDHKSEVSVAIVTFIRPNSHRFGIVNDEAVDGHPLWNKGLEVYRAHLIENSSWIEELKSIHKAHPRYTEKHWISSKHFLLFFHDEIFEIIAEAYKIEVTNSTIRNVALEVAKRLNSE